MRAARYWLAGGSLAAVMVGLLADPAAAQTVPIMRRPMLPLRGLVQVGPPDLTVENIREEGGAVLADVRNVGGGPAGATKVALFARGISSVEQDFAPLAAGQMRTVRFDRPAGTTSVQIMIDPGNLIAEANEVNNRPPNFILGTAPVASGAASALRGQMMPGRPVIAGLRPLPARQQPAVAPTVLSPAVAAPPPGRMTVPVLVADTDSGPADEIIPPSGLQVVGRPGAVTLRPSGYRPMMQTLPAVRQLQVDSLRANPRLTIGRTQVDFKPVFANPRALVNIAQKLRTTPQLAQVRVDRMEAVEIPQGLVVRSFLNYSLKPGVCRDASRRAAIAATGIQCAARMDGGARAAAFANPKDPRYVADAGLRAQKLAEANAIAAKQDQETAAAVATLRAQLNDPAGFATIAAAIGADQAAQFKTLDDTALAGELINSGETKVEQVAFLAKQDEAETAPPKKKSSPPPPLTLPAPLDQTWDIGTYTYLTGFTLGRENEWRQRVETTIKWCLVGCKKTYFAEVYAGFKYGFGLRFPVRLTGKYRYVRNKPGEVPTLTANLAMINGGPDDYLATGLPNYQLFNAKELVAEVGAHAGFNAKLPLIGTRGVDFSVGKDFTEGLPAPFTNGQFAPPDPLHPLVTEIKFEDFDLIGGRANFGAFGAKVFPAVQVSLESTDLRMDVVDIPGKKTVPLVFGGPPVKLGTDPETSAADFRIENPSYTIKFGLTPGIVARLFIDLGVWGDNWDWPVWFPDMKITLPPGGLQFGCHADTVCSRSFHFVPDGADQPAFFDDLQIWAYNFENKYLPQCLDETCQFGIRFVRLGTVLYGKTEFNKNKQFNKGGMTYAYGMAEEQAKQLLLEGQARKTVATSEAWAILAEAVWTKKCQDKPCFDEVRGIAKTMGPRAKALQLSFPDESSLAIQGMVGKEVGPKFATAVKQSEMRVTTNALMKGMNANPLPKQTLPGFKPH